MTTPNELRAIAEAATAGEWTTDPHPEGAVFEIYAGDLYIAECPWGMPDVDVVPRMAVSRANARFIATFDPPTVLRLLADLEAAEARGWQPIETAPKDGTKFDAWVPDAFGGYRMAGLSFNTRGKLRQHGLLTEADLPRWPSHWRPLPEPPAHRSSTARRPRSG